MTPLVTLEFVSGAYFTIIAAMVSTHGFVAQIMFKVIPAILAVILIADAIVRFSAADTIAALEWWHATASEK
ncbi:hypothetical protein [Maritimibacter sp. UBA3975]|uniref:hypothetical protein n=1 Tax=Maritimibacter sp. UBA3975 TaxID=1946833 RepID=UPI000C08E748|nr:hypothetical protein [Maritimibacter sp. UBA3975]MAM60817.1 hypothetical protein [Maritimibacter sp.]|tara:strand:+ start:12500 stop:12715 length:216 start_codon:yes stop_codon:yes gene_type:complete